MRMLYAYDARAGLSDRRPRFADESVRRRSNEVTASLGTSSSSWTCFSFHIKSIASRTMKTSSSSERPCDAFAFEHPSDEPFVLLLDQHVIWFHEMSLPENSYHPICLIISLANSEHLISFAPSICRAKSYVTVLAPIVRSNPLMIRSAASCHPMYSNIM
jgi:hypothetical protein